MSEQPPHWGEFSTDRARAQPSPRDADFDALCARVLKSNDGRKLLAELRHRYFDNFGNPMADERALRVRATQQQFVRELETACERGTAAAAQRTNK